MTTEDVVHGWTKVYPHVRYAQPIEAILWLSSAFGFREKVRMARPDGSTITSKLETPGGGLVMIAGYSHEFNEWMRSRVSEFRESADQGWPKLSHSITVMVSDVDTHYQQAKAAGAKILMPPTDHPWGLHSYAVIDIEGNQWEFAQVHRIVEPEDWGATRFD